MTLSSLYCGDKMSKYENKVMEILKKEKISF
jgi:hypothetical protein